MRQYQKSQRFLVPALTIPFPFLFCKAEDEGQPEPALTIPFPVNKFPNKIAPKVANNKLKNPRFCSFTSFWTVLETTFSKIFESSSARITFIIAFISSFEIIKVVVCKAEDKGWPDPNIFLCIPASDASVNPKEIKTLLADGLNYIFY